MEVAQAEAEHARVQRVLADHRHHQEELKRTLQRLELSQNIAKDKHAELSASLRAHRAEMSASAVSSADMEADAREEIQKRRLRDRGK